ARPGRPAFPTRRSSDLRRKAGVERITVLPELAHRPEHGDAAVHVAFGAEALQRRRHRCGIGIIALVDQQHLAAIHLQPVPFSTRSEEHTSELQSLAYLV